MLCIYLPSLTDYPPPKSILKIMSNKLWYEILYITYHVHHIYLHVIYIYASFEHKSQGDEVVVKMALS